MNKIEALRFGGVNIKREEGDSRVLSQICGIIAEVMEVDVDSVQPDVNIYTQLGVDSLAILSVFVSVKRTFGVSEPQNAEEFPPLYSPRLIAEYVLLHPECVVAR